MVRQINSVTQALTPSTQDPIPHLEVVVKGLGSNELLIHPLADQLILRVQGLAQQGPRL